MDRPVFLIGMKHSGKSSIGRRVARRLGLPFEDVDREAERAAMRESGVFRPVRRIYAELGREEFARLEAEACERLASTPAIVATGGGVCDNPCARSALSGGIKVLFDDDEETLFRRIVRGGIPPFLETEDAAVARERFALLYARRMERYLEMADLVVDMRGLDICEAVAVVADRIRETLSGGK